MVAFFFGIAGIASIVVTIGNYLGLKAETIDYVECAFLFLIGSVMTFIALIGLIDISHLKRFLLFQLLCSGILGIISCIFLKDVVVDKPIIRTEFEEIQYLFLFLLCLGFGMFLFSRRIARIFVLASIIGYGAMCIIMFGLRQDYYLMLTGIYWLLLAGLFYWKTAAILAIAPASAIILSFLSFLHYKRITWYFGFNPTASRNHSIIPINFLEPYDYIYLSESPDKFYSVVIFNLVLGILLFAFSLWLIIGYYKDKDNSSLNHNH